MSELPQETEEWLSLRDAAARLGVHPTTLRRWADNGDIPVMFTPGGHRRFTTADIADFMQAHHGRRHDVNIETLWADQALTHTRQEIVVHNNDHWLVQLDEDSRDAHRRLGRQLMGLTLQYLSAGNGQQFLTEAQGIGRQYARLSLQAGLPLPEALEAAMFFRDTLVETALQLPENTHIRPEANMHLLRRINTLLNAVHLAIAEIYDASYTNSLPGA